MKNSIEGSGINAGGDMSTLKTYIIVLNWNSWADTVECLESVLRSDYGDYQVIVCDNASGDGSMERIKAWAEGSLQHSVRDDNPLKRLSSPPVEKPISYVAYDRCTAEAGGDEGAGNARLILIQTGGNLGFAGGCNVGLRYALARDDFGYAWLLNNDTVVEPGALAAMVRKMEQDPGIGMCGSTLLYYYKASTVQIMGGCDFNKWLAMPRPLGSLERFSGNVDEDEIEKSIHYVAGASLLVSRDLLKKVGMMSEQYFLFFEEIDWAVRAKGLFRNSYASKSIVYHKEGACTGTNSRDGRNSPLSEYYFNRNRLIFTGRYYPTALPFVIAGIAVSILNRMKRRQYENARMIAKALFNITP